MASHLTSAAIAPHTCRQRPLSQGFSLVELSIVLVILGLLVGGILAGQSLVRAAELRTITTDVSAYRTAVGVFRDKYFAIPGDMQAATKFWGKDAGYCAAETTTVTSPGTCNGNGDGIISPPASGGVTGENFQFWRQLALSGLIGGTYSGIAGTLGPRDTFPGLNSPKTKLGGAGYGSIGYGIEYIYLMSGDLYAWDGAYQNTIFLGSLQPSQTPGFPAFRAEEAWNIDTKLDDGKPATGVIRTFRKYADWINCTTTNVEATTTYNLSNSSLTCNLLILTGF